MTGRRGRLARGAVLAVAAGLLFTVILDLYARRLLFNPGDAALAARFRAHRAEFRALLGEEQAGARARSLGLDGRARREGDSLIYFAAPAWFVRWRFDDTKGYAFSARPPENLVEDLDAVLVPPRRRGEVLRWHRPLEGDWYLYREVGSRGMR